MTFCCSSLDFGPENWTSADVLTFFCSSHDFGPENWTSADVLTFFALHLTLGRKTDGFK